VAEAVSMFPGDRLLLYTDGLMAELGLGPASPS
jgi:hypothetical protein